MGRYILTLDQGTTSSRAILFDEHQHILGMAQKELRQIYPREGWVEYDPMEIWSSQSAVMMEALAQSGVRVSDVAAIGLANQRETTIVWEKATGKPVCNAICWQCRRTADLADELVKKGLTDHIKSITGLVPDAYFSATKLQWILDRVDPKRERARRGELLFGTVDSWLVWKLTNDTLHVTDATNASRTMLYNIHTGQWDDTLLAAMDIPMEMLPEVVESSQVCGYAEVAGAKIPIAGMIGDQQAALFGQTCWASGEAKNTYGTGCFLLMNTGEKPVVSHSGLLTTIAIRRNGVTQYALEGSAFMAGAVIQWLRDELGLISKIPEAETIAQSVSDTGGIYLVPAFTGLGAPYWDMDARGCLVGITHGTKRAHVVRAAQESIAYQVRDLVVAMEKDTGMVLAALNADGGSSRDAFLLQFQADILNKPVRRPAVRETTALGAAYLAGLAVGIWNDTDELLELWKEDTTFQPQMAPWRRDTFVEGWNRAVQRSLKWIVR